MQKEENKNVGLTGEGTAQKEENAAGGSEAPGTPSGTVFDDVFRTIVDRFPDLFIPLINEVFGTNYSGDERVRILKNEHFEEHHKLITDALFEIGGRLYQIECQSKKDGKMTLRMVRYGLLVAVEHAEEDEDGNLVVEIPSQCVLYIRNHRSVPDYHKSVFRAPNGETLEVSVPTIQSRKYDLDGMFKKHLLVLLPYHILKYEHFAKGKGEDRAKIERICEDMRRIVYELNEIANEDGKSDLYYDLIGLIKDVAEYVVSDENPVKKEIFEILEGKEVADMKLRTDYIKEELDQKYGQQMREKDGLISKMQGEMSHMQGEMSHMQGEMSHMQGMVSQMKYCMAQKDQENEKLRQYFIDHKIAMPL